VTLLLPGSRMFRQQTVARLIWNSSARIPPKYSCPFIRIPHPPPRKTLRTVGTNSHLTASKAHQYWGFKPPPHTRQTCRKATGAGHHRQPCRYDAITKGETRFRKRDFGESRSRVWPAITRPSNPTQQVVVHAY
jgi:hypothetical protein